MWWWGLGAQIPPLIMGLRGPMGPGGGRREICAQSVGRQYLSAPVDGPGKPAMTKLRRSRESGF